MFLRGHSGLSKQAQWFHSLLSLSKHQSHTQNPPQLTKLPQTQFTVVFVCCHWVPHTSLSPPFSGDPGLQAKSYHCNDNIKQAQPFFFLCFFFSIQCPTHILLMPSTEQHFKQLLLCWCFVLAIPSLHSSKHGFSNMENHPNGFCCVPALLSLEGSPLFVSSWQDYPASWTTPGGLSAVFWLCQSGWQEAKSSLLLLCWSWIRPSFKTTGFVVEWRSATLLTFLSKNMKFNIGCSCVWSVSWRPWLFFTWGGGILWKWTFQTKWGVSVEEWV